MAITDKNTLKSWFKRGLKPLASQFEAWMDSYYHKGEKIPVDSVDGLSEVLIDKVDQAAAAQMVKEAVANIQLPEATLEKKGIVQLTNTPSSSTTEAACPALVEQVAEAKANALRGELATNAFATDVATTKAEEAATALRGGVPAEGDTLKKLHDFILFLQSLVSSDDVNLDTVKEIVAFIKNNKDVIDTIATSKVAIADIVDSLTSAEANKPLSANQGRVLAELIAATASASKAIRLAIGFSVSTEAVNYFPSAATVTKLTWSAADIATVQVSVAGGAFSPITSGAPLTLAVAAGAPMQIKITYAASKTIGSILLEGTYS